MIVAAYDVDDVFIIELNDVQEIEMVQEAWNTLIDGIAAGNYKLYTACYKECLGIPGAEDTDEEVRIIHEKFGDNPAENTDFVTATHTAASSYKKQRVEYPEFEKWAEQHGYPLTRIEYLIRL